jgi:RNA polymerase sigma-70 factor (ECF subfamily)
VTKDTRDGRLDRDTFTGLYRENVEGIQRYLARRVGDPLLAADLTAEVFLAAIESAARFDAKRGTPRAWLFGIAKTLVAAEARRNRRENDVVRRISGRALVKDGDLARMHERMDAARLSDVLNRALDKLAPAEREIFELVAFDELSVAEAALVAGIRPTAARVRMHRARSRLKGELANTPPTATTLRELS